jgi:hypothetical protein
MVRGLLLIGLLGAAAAGALAVERAPRAPVGAPPTPEDVAGARDLLREFRRITEAPGTAESLSITADEIDGLFRLAARTRPGLGGQARIEGDALVVDLSMPMPLVPDLGWLNLTAVLPAFEARAQVSQVQLGRLSLPPGPTQAAALHLIDAVFGEPLGTGLVARLPWMDVTGDAVVLGIAMDASDRRAMARRTLEAIHGEAMPTLDEIGAHVEALRTARAEGRLAVGAPLPEYYALMLDLAAERARARPDDPGRELVAGFLAIGHVCGTTALVGLIGPRAGEALTELPDPAGMCRRTTLSGRPDLRQHFVTAAAIKAVSSRSVALSAGEAKELYDLFRTGFDFTDIAANNSGIRFAERMVAASPRDWPALARRVASEGDVMIPLDGLPGAMNRAEFEARFGEVDSPAYLQVIEQIEARIDALPFHGL